MQVNYYHVHDDVRFYCDKCGKETPVGHIHEFGFFRDTHRVTVQLCDDCCKDVTCAELLGMPCTVYESHELYDNAETKAREEDWLGDD